MYSLHDLSFCFPLAPLEGYGLSVPVLGQGDVALIPHWKRTFYPISKQFEIEQARVSQQGSLLSG
ncbi:hypothetical protein [Oleiphilus messinensis]|uniref:hypothetical protein n=1 Tax=Oleiphilus messinensis TaxID=141451 RepID=UPI0012F881D6|nr:hypothetical protein [Oleiphilus messinensis]